MLGVTSEEDLKQASRIEYKRSHKAKRARLTEDTEDQDKNEEPPAKRGRKE
jgi:hypothetical protein